VRIPVATYRLQINDDFTLHDARAVVPYLARLGISDLYLSPIFEARAGSTHGYDVTDPACIRASIGGLDALRALAEETRRHHMGILLDIVPNHMSATVQNAWWRDVLARGRASRYAHFFDIDWGPAERPERIELPILGDTLDALLARGEITIDGETREVVYHETRLPLADGTAHAGDARAILDRQHYDLVFWRRAAEHMAYRRFFDITDLAGVRVEDDEVFEAMHVLVRDLCREGIVTGLRIDHIDGLRDPQRYLDQLRAFVRGPDGGPVYTVVEKILEKSERIPGEWACEGTTGYEFLTFAIGLLTDPAGHDAIERHYRHVTADTRPFDELVHEKKMLVMDRLFGGELAALARGLSALTGLDHAASRTAIAALTAGMRVYRTYTRSSAVGDEDMSRLVEARDNAVARAGTDPERSALNTLFDIVAMRDGTDSAGRLDWVMRWQQFTGPVMAKGFEDTALYCHNVLLAANDVGSDPVRPSLHADELLGAMRTRLDTTPLALNATATHDTKRGEDTRARIAVLSEIPDEWRARLRRWMRAGDAWQSEADEDEGATPSANVQSLLYQTLAGSWPLDGVSDDYRERIKAYMTKAVREAKEHTSWRRPDEDYEEALSAFIDQLMAEIGRAGLAEDIGTFAERLAQHGALNSIAQLLLKATAPGIPDFYQGTERWSFTLVDPDNRRPVDYAANAAALDALIPLLDTPDDTRTRDLLMHWKDGRIKQLMTAHVLRFRARNRDVFERGDVIGLEVTGESAAHVFAFARVLGEQACITVLPRFTTRPGDALPVGEAWGDTAIELPASLRCSWHNALTGRSVDAAERVSVSDLFRHIPFALLDLSRPVGA
jgi:(1->4)-alpha-D-glucan 1-alpha-D-glucosylmutase